MSKKFNVEYREWESDGKAHYYDSYYYEQYNYRRLTIKDVKEFVKEQRYKIHKPVCTCCLKIWRKNGDNTIKECDDYYDSTYLDNTVFSESNPVKVIQKKYGKCTCGELDRLIMSSNYEKQREEDQKRWEERERQNREYYDGMINNIQNERNRERQENLAKFQNIERERNREREANNQRFNILEYTLREKEQQLQKNTQKLEENEKRKKFREKCEKNAENEFINQNYNIYQAYFGKNKTSVAEEIKNKISQLINKNIKFENINDDFIYKIVKTEKFIKSVREFIEDKFSNSYDDNLNINISSFNIIVLGNTGVGKSTLLNTVLKEQLAKTAFGDACTMGVPQPYESGKAKGIRIWDSRGIENGKYNLETAFNDIKNTIDCLIKENDPDKFIHCIWYCIRSNRFTEEEADNLKNCYNSYIEKLPIIVVFTQSENQKMTDKMMENVKAKLENNKKLNGFNEKSVNDIKILKVLAQDYENDFGVVKSFGIHNLMEQTSENAKIGIERACTHSLMEKGKNMLREEFDEIINKLKEKIFTNQNTNNNGNFQLNNILGNILNEEKNKSNKLNINIINNFDFVNFNNFCKLFSRELVKLLLFNDSISEETIVSIDNNLDEVSKELYNYVQKEFESLLENISNKLAEELVDFVHSLEAKYQVSTLSSKYNYNELKRQAKNGINREFKNIIEDIIYREISKIIYNKFSEKFSNELMNCFHFLLKNNKSIKEIFTKRGQENTVACMDKIKNLMDYPSDSYEERNPKKKEQITKKSKYEDFGEDDE